MSINDGISIAKYGSRIQAIMTGVKEFNAPTPSSAHITDYVGRMEDLPDSSAIVLARALILTQTMDMLVAQTMAGIGVSRNFYEVVEDMGELSQHIQEFSRQHERGGPNLVERARNIVSKLVYGDIASRYSKLEDKYRKYQSVLSPIVERNDLVIRYYEDALNIIHEISVAMGQSLSRYETEFKQAHGLSVDAEIAIATLEDSAPKEKRDEVVLQQRKAATQLSRATRKLDACKTVARMLELSLEAGNSTLKRFKKAASVLNSLQQRLTHFFSVQAPLLSSMRINLMGGIAADSLAQTQSMAHQTGVAPSAQEVWNTIFDFRAVSANVLKDLGAIATNEAGAVRNNVISLENKFKELIS